MKIYNVIKVPQGLGYDDYEAIYQSGYTAGYEEGYNSAPCYKKQYCTIEALEDGNISIGNNVQYSINDGDWVSGASGDIIAVNAGDVVRFKGINAGAHTFTGFTLKYMAYGNVMSLLYGDDFIGKTEIGDDNAFSECFALCHNLMDASNIILPATTLTTGCYHTMFGGCTSLTTAPELPATTLAPNCYAEMFSKCTGLETAPELPATTLATYCYNYMFRDCSSLTTAPELPATTLTSYCYSNMFTGCTSLTTAPELPATTLEERCYQAMFYGCSNLNYVKCLATNRRADSTVGWVRGVAASGTFVKDANATWSTGTGGIPENWTVQDAQ